jgi:hypothetical protein
MDDIYHLLEHWKIENALSTLAEAKWEFIVSHSRKSPAFKMSFNSGLKCHQNSISQFVFIFRLPLVTGWPAEALTVARF